MNPPRDTTTYVCVRGIRLSIHPCAESSMKYRKGNYTPGCLLVFDDVQHDGDWMMVHFPGADSYHYIHVSEWDALERLE